MDFESPVPLFRQISRFLARQIENGGLPAESRLPSTRQLAADLGVSRIVVANAYAELEAEGLVEGRRGSGTYVAELPGVARADGFLSPRDWPLWQQELGRTWQPACEELARLLSSADRPGTISFAEQTVAESTWPADDLRRALQGVLRRDGPEAVGAGDSPAGYRPLRAIVAGILSSEGIPTEPQHVIVTSGSQQALNLVAGLLLRPGDVVLVESPTYNVALDLFRSRDVRLLGVPVDEEGMQVERIEELVRAVRPRLIYTIPTFHNPTGACMSGLRRRKLIALADRYSLPILEDDFIANLRYEGQAEPALKALDGTGNVIYAGTFSKVLMPGLRVGYLVAHGPVYDRLLTAKYLSDLATSDLMQRALTEYISVGRFRAHLRRVCQANRARRDALLAGLARHLPPETRWLHPKGGRYVWLQLPEGLSANALFPLAAQEGVSFVPGSFFFAAERPQSYLRLNFALNTPEQNEEGARRLGRAVQRLLASCRSA